MKVFNIRMNNHEEHEGHEEKCFNNFVFSVFFVVNIAFGVS
jgi:hypothetical protein